MKKITVSRRSLKGFFWSKGVTALFLLSGFQITNFCASKPLGEVLNNMTYTQLCTKIADTNISKPVKGIDYLHAAAATRDPDKVQAVLDKVIDKSRGIKYKNQDKYKNTFPNIVDRRGETVMKKVIDRCTIRDSYQAVNQEILKRLIRHPYIEVDNMGKDTFYGHMTAMLVALEKKDQPTAILLLNECAGYGGRLDITMPHPETGATPLHLSLKAGFDDVTQLLLGLLPADRLYVKDNHGKTPLYLAINAGAQGIAELLIEKIDASITPLDSLTAGDADGNALLHLAVNLNSTSLVKSLVSKIRNYASRSLSLGYLLATNRKGESPLHLAIHKNAQEIFNYLLIQIRDLCHDSDEWISKLFMRYNNEYVNINMLQYFINTVAHTLSPNEWKRIREQIKILENSEQMAPAHAKSLQTIIDHAYANAHNLW